METLNTRKSEPTAALKQIRVLRNGRGWVLETGKSKERINLVQVNALMESILKTHPAVPRGIDLAWNNRHGPKAQIYSVYGVVGREVKVTEYRIEVLILDEVAGRVKNYPSVELVIAGLTEAWGDDVDVLPEFEADLVSKKLAENELVFLQAEDYCKEQGITIQELFSQIAGKE